MNEHLTYLNIKYGSEDYSTSILLELPVEIVFSAYRKYYNDHLTLFECYLSDEEIIYRFTHIIENIVSKPESKFNRLFSKHLSDEIKKYYE